MNIINFVSGGRLGDFIHSLYVVKNICEQRNAKANLFLNEGGDTWTFGIEKAFHDLYPIISKQPYIENFAILPTDISLFTYIDLNDWRKEVATTHAETGKYNKCWSDLLSQHYGFEIPKKYQWLFVDEVDKNTVGRIVMHRSKRHHAWDSAWRKNTFQNPTPMFATTDQSEFEEFILRDEVIPYILPTVSEWIVAIASCKIFIGNQSAGFAIASALDKKRIVELYPDAAPFYVGEEKYSNNINWII